MANEFYKSNKDTAPQLFQNKVLDAVFSQAHYSTPVLIYIPLVVFFLYLGIVVMETNALQVGGLFFVGYAAWTLFEYVLHRFLLHWIPDNAFGKKLHFWVHGIHHDYPKVIRVVPPGRSLPGFAILWLLFYFVLGPAYWHGAFAGFVVGYVCYDMVHYAIHKVKAKNKWFDKLQKHHMYHHYRNPDSSYGFVTTFWDWIFRTRLKDLGDAKKH